MTPWLTVLHHPGRPAYLQRTLVELDAAGAGELARAGCLHRLIAVDGPTAAVAAPPGWGVFSVGDGRRGTRPAMLATMQAAAAAAADHLLYFEDDVAACRNAVRALDLIPVHPQCGFLVACNCRGQVLTERRHYPRMALAQTSRRDEFWGSQSLKLPLRSLEFLSDVEITAGDGNHSDVWLGQTLARKWPNFALLSPSIFQHVGNTSLCSPDKTFATHPQRQASDFDASFNALEIAEIYAAAGDAMFRPR